MLKSMLIFIILFSSIVSATEKAPLQWNGQVQIEARQDLAPSSVNSHNAFDISVFKIQAGSEFYAEMGWTASVRFVPQPSPNNGYQTDAVEAYIKAQKIFSDDDDVHYGAIANLWIELVEGHWGLQDLSRYSQSLLRQAAYNAPTDLGVSYYQMRSRWKWAFSLVNGTGFGTKSAGKSKDGEFVVEVSPFEPSSAGGKLILAAHYLAGAYDGVDDSIAKKERTGVLLGWVAPTGVSIMVEGFRALDPVDKITGKVVDGVDLSAQGGQAATAEGAAAYGKWRWDSANGKWWQLHTQMSWIQPMKSATNRSYRSEVYGVSYQPRPPLVFSLSEILSQYSDGYAASDRDTQAWSFSTRIDF